MDFNLIMYYTPLGEGVLGEEWTIYSWIQAAGTVLAFIALSDYYHELSQILVNIEATIFIVNIGFIILVGGTLIYSKGDEKEVARAIRKQI